ncbi:hypothetical protein ABH994_005593 [Bradyrhizobium yuanmingense]
MRADDAGTDVATRCSSTESAEHTRGNKDRAIELIEVTLKSLDGPAPAPDDLKQHVISVLVQTLANYKDEKACYGSVCATPQPGVRQSTKAQAPEERR